MTYIKIISLKNKKQLLEKQYSLFMMRLYQQRKGIHKALPVVRLRLWDWYEAPKDLFNFDTCSVLFKRTIILLLYI